VILLKVCASHCSCGQSRPANQLVASLGQDAPTPRTPSPGQVATSFVTDVLRLTTLLFSRPAEPLEKLSFVVSVPANMIKQTFDHLTEIAEILAAGLTRLEARKSSRKPADFGESSLHFSPDQSGGVPSYAPEASHD